MHFIKSKKLEHMAFESLPRSARPQGESNKPKHKIKVATSYMKRKKLDKIPIVFPRACSNSIQFENHSEKKRHEQTLQMLVNLKHFIQTNPEKKMSYIKEFLDIYGIDINLDSLSKISGLSHFIKFLLSSGGNSVDESRINPKLTARENILRIIHGEDDAEDLTSPKPREYKSIALSYDRVKPIKEEYLNDSDYRTFDIEGNKVVPKQMDNEYDVKQTNTSQPKQPPVEKPKASKTNRSSKYASRMRREREREMEEIYNEFKLISQDKFNDNSIANTKEEMMRYVKNELEKNNLQDCKNVIFPDDSYFDSRRLYRKSLENIPTKGNQLSTIRDVYKKGKVLEYVISKNLNEDDYYSKELKKLEEEVKIKLNRKK